jgi:hypothetical protein
MMGSINTLKGTKSPALVSREEYMHKCSDVRRTKIHIKCPDLWRTISWKPLGLRVQDFLWKGV